MVGRSNVTASPAVRQSRLLDGTGLSYRINSATSISLIAPQVRDVDAGSDTVVLDEVRLDAGGAVAQSVYFSWSKEFLEAGKRRLSGDTARQASSAEVKELRAEAAALKEVVADLTLVNRLLKKKYERGWGQRCMRYPASEKIEIIRLVEGSSEGATTMQSCASSTS